VRLSDDPDYVCESREFFDWLDADLAELPDAYPPREPWVPRLLPTGRLGGATGAHSMGYEDWDGS
jgi:hypothetical protein